MGIRHAVQERRLGQLRQRQYEDDLSVHSIRRSQCDVRSADGGYNWKNSGDAGDLWLHARGQARGEGCQVHTKSTRTGWKLVWTLGSELHLRYLPGAARA